MTSYAKPVHPMVAVPDALRTVLRETARKIVADSGQPSQSSAVLNVEAASIQDLLGKTLVADVNMAEPGYPPYNASIMDGYAIRVDEFRAGNGNNSHGSYTHRVVDKIYAGVATRTTEAFSDDSSDPSLDRSSVAIAVALYITTGAVVPDGFDCVVPMENCTVSIDGTHISVQPTATIERFKWIRKIGCDIPPGSRVLSAGHELDPVAIGLLLQSGVSHIHVKTPLRVGVLSTGNELLSSDPDQKLARGLIPDTNRPILLSLLSTFGTCEPVDLGIERDDDIQSLESTLANALQSCDVIISTGGISMGESDTMEEALVHRLGGTLHFGRMHMKPGKPTTFVTIRISSSKRTKMVFAMPGNPVSAVVCTQLLVRPCLDLMWDGPDQSGDAHGESTDEMIHRIVQNAKIHPEFNATIAHEMKLDKERPEYHRVTLKALEGKTIATSTGVQRSSRLMSLRDAEALVILPQGVPGGKMKAEAGETYTALLLNYSSKDDRAQVCDSAHLNRKAHKSLRVAVIHVVSAEASLDGALETMAKRVITALSGTKSGPADLASQRTYAGPPDDLYSFAVQGEENTDVIVVVCQNFRGCYQYHLDISTMLASRLQKGAESMALQARRGAAAEDSSAALFEATVGFVPEGRGSIMICLPENGTVGGLQHVRGLLKHALITARGTGNHN